jgi:HlyD family secretion protein
MKKAVVLLVLLIVIGGTVFYVLRNKKPKDENVVRVSGNIEITDAAASFKIAGRVTERLVTEGDMVKAGQIIARLDDVDLKQEVNLRRAELDAANASLKELHAGFRPEEIQETTATLARAKAEEERYKKDFERQQGLFQKEVISQRELDATRMSYETASAKVRETEQQLTLRKKGFRTEQIEQGEAKLQQAQQALDIAQTKLGYATIVSPFDGLVLSKSIEAGEYVSAGTPVVTIGQMNNVWLRAYIDETDLGRVHVGQSAKVKTDSYPNKTYPGQISFISSESEFTPKTVQTEKERVKLVYRIKIDISNPEMQLKPGMPADAEIALQKSAS